MTLNERSGSSAAVRVMAGVVVAAVIAVLGVILFRPLPTEPLGGDSGEDVGVAAVVPEQGRDADSGVDAGVLDDPVARRTEAGLQSMQAAPMDEDGGAAPRSESRPEGREPAQRAAVEVQAQTPAPSVDTLEREGDAPESEAAREGSPESRPEIRLRAEVAGASPADLVDIESETPALEPRNPVVVSDEDLQERVREARDAVKAARPGFR